MITVKSKYKEIINYLIFGVLTTVVNFICFYVLELFLPVGYLINNGIAWFLSVAFAYFTNKLFVFDSKSFGAKILIKEILEFFGARVFSFAVEEAGLFLLVDLLAFKSLEYTVLGFNVTGELIAKVILAVIVVIMNYFFSKFIIFKNKK